MLRYVSVLLKDKEWLSFQVLVVLLSGFNFIDEWAFKGWYKCLLEVSKSVINKLILFDSQIYHRLNKFICTLKIQLGAEELCLRFQFMWGLIICLKRDCCIFDSAQSLCDFRGSFQLVVLPNCVRLLYARRHRDCPLSKLLKHILHYHFRYHITHLIHHSFSWPLLLINFKSFKSSSNYPKPANPFHFSILPFTDFLIMLKQSNHLQF